MGSVLQVNVHFAPAQTIQAWTPNTGDAEPHRSGAAVTVRFPGESFRVLASGGSAVPEEAELARVLDETG